ncbi:hypothetical protein DL771_000864 [Monosporascus sp. 5C6A]|nr:hypothetical protein DL771_000864 [Monosporascus sp. 5C6A]
MVTITKKLSSSWRKPKGIDSAVRRRFRGRAAMPKIGYGSAKKTRHMMPSGHKAFLVHNEKDVELLLMHRKTFAAEIAHGVSSRKRVGILSKARALGVKVRSTFCDNIREAGLKLVGNHQSESE